MKTLALFFAGILAASGISHGREYVSPRAQVDALLVQHERERNYSQQQDPYLRAAMIEADKRRDAEKRQLAEMERIRRQLEWERAEWQRELQRIRMENARYEARLRAQGR